jgi:hypothetical protein
MFNYTRIIGKTSTNIRTPTVAEIAQGNNQLTIFESRKNNGYLNEMSQQLGDVSTELTNLITDAGLTPDGTLTQVSQAVALLAPSPPATESTAGIAPIASLSEVEAGLNDTKFVTPSKLRFGFQASFNANGHIGFPSWLGGLIIQWGQSLAIGLDGVATVNFTTPFLLSCFSVVCTAKSNNAITDDAAAVQSFTNTTANLIRVGGFGADENNTIYWWAVGK